MTASQKECQSDISIHGLAKKKCPALLERSFFHFTRQSQGDKCCNLCGKNLSKLEKLCPFECTVKWLSLTKDGGKLLFGDHFGLERTFWILSRGVTMNMFPDSFFWTDVKPFKGSEIQRVLPWPISHRPVGMVDDLYHFCMHCMKMAEHLVEAVFTALLVFGHTVAPINKSIEYRFGNLEDLENCKGRNFFNLLFKTTSNLIKSNTVSRSSEKLREKGWSKCNNAISFPSKTQGAKLFGPGWGSSSASNLGICGYFPFDKFLSIFFQFHSFDQEIPYFWHQEWS